MKLLETLKTWARRIKAQVLTLWFCSRHPDTPLAAKLLAGLVAAYALSPIDLIPDFIPVLGYLDELILLPLGIMLVMRMIPEPVVAACRLEAERWLAERGRKPRNYVAGALIVMVWLLLAYWTWRLCAGWFGWP